MARDRESKGFRPPQGAIDRERFEALVRRVDALEKRVNDNTSSDTDIDSTVSSDQGLDKKGLVDKALELGVLGPNGEPAPRSVLERWKTDRLSEAIAARPQLTERA